MALVAAIPPGNLMAQMPDPMAMTSMAELLEARRLLEMVYENGAHWPAGTFTTWKVVPATPAAAAAHTKSEKAEALLVTFVQTFPHALSFNWRHLDALAPGMAALRSEHALGLQKNHPAFSVSTSITQRKFFEL